MDKYELQGTTYIQDVKKDPRDNIKVEIGDSKQSDFKPQFKVMRWDNEVNFSMRAQEDPLATVVKEGDIIKYVSTNYEVHQYDKPEVSEDGGFEFEWVLNTPPPTNILIATIQTKGLDFFYQHKLSQEEIDDGHVRPENVEGSYAVYHSSKGTFNKLDGMNYKTGKAFHIYRPKATDSKNEEIWCDLNIDVKNGILIVTVPQKFLDTAVYPVKIDPTFGYTGIGATDSVFASFTTGLCTRRGRGLPYAGGTATLTSISAAIHADSDVPRTVDTTVYINLENTVTDSHNEVAKIEILGNSTTGLPAFYDFTAAGQALSDNYYILNIVGDRADVPINGLYIRSDTGVSGNQYSETNATYATIRDETPWTETDSGGTTIYSIYATHTGSGQFTWNNFQHVRSVSAGVMSVTEKIR